MLTFFHFFFSKLLKVKYITVLFLKIGHHNFFSLVIIIYFPILLYLIRWYLGQLINLRIIGYDRQNGDFNDLILIYYFYVWVYENCESFTLFENFIFIFKYFERDTRTVVHVSDVVHEPLFHVSGNNHKAYKLGLLLFNFVNTTKKTTIRFWVSGYCN